MSVCESYLADSILSESGSQNLNEELMVRTSLKLYPLQVILNKSV